jgi:phospholipase C
VPFDFKRLGLRVPAILISPWLQPAVDSTVYSHSTIPGTMIEALSLPDGFLTKRDANANKLTKHLLDDGKRSLRTDTPHLTVSVQPEPLDAISREILDGTVHLDPHPNQRNTLRTKDIQDPMQAKQFMRTQIAKHLEHYFASNGTQAVANRLTTEDAVASTSLSPARIAELKRSAKRKPRGVRP